MSAEAANHRLTDAQSVTIRDELRRVLESDAFAGSKRCQEFLQFVVEHALSGEPDRLKERAIGAELFGRDVGYETATDPIVRVKANDVRRRLTRYNLEVGESGPVKILLPPGSYVPEFQFVVPAEAAPPSEESASLPPVPGGKHRFGLRAIAVAALVAVAAGVAALTIRVQPSPLDRFWGPAIEGSGPIMVCFGRTYSIWLSENAQHQMEEHPQSVSIRPGEYYRVYDSMTSAGNIRAALAVVGLLEKRNKPAEVLWASEARANDLRDRSLVLLGAFNNPWTMDLNSDVRFVFEQERRGDQLLWVIRDRKTEGRKWTLAATFPQPIERDYAIITRIFDRQRARVVISAGGMNHFGTQVAGEFLCDAAFWRELANSNPRNWHQKNLQVVLEMEIVANKPVRPRVIDSYFW